MKFLLNIIIAASIGVSALPSAAQFVKDDGTDPRSKPVTMEVRPVSPGVADLVWHNAGVNFLNAQVLPAGVTAASRDEVDAAGKGTARNVAYSAYSAVFAGYKHCVTVAGPNNYAGGKENARFDLKKMACAAAAPDVTVRVSFGSVRNELFGIVPVLLTADGQYVGWAWHGVDVSRQIARPGSSSPDVITVLFVDGSGNVRLASDAEFERYKNYYARMF